MQVKFSIAERDCARKKGNSSCIFVFLSESEIDFKAENKGNRLTVTRCARRSFVEKDLSKDFVFPFQSKISHMQYYYSCGNLNRCKILLNYKSNLFANKSHLTTHTINNLDCHSLAATWNTPLQLL